MTDKIDPYPADTGPAPDEPDQWVIPPARSFAQFLAQIAGGDFLRELSEAQRDMVAEMENRRLDGAKTVKGEMTLSFKMKLDGGVFEIVPDFKIKLPDHKRDKQVFWATKDNHLTLENPQQQRLPFRTVGDRRAPRPVGSTELS